MLLELRRFSRCLRNRKHFAHFKVTYSKNPEMMHSVTYNHILPRRSLHTDEVLLSDTKL